ncbi:MAG: thiamine-phosphate kinase, partial [Pseudomonadota bacterium]
DDCSVIEFDSNRFLLGTTDSLLEGVHFLKEMMTPEEIAYKALAVNVSDVVAMGGRPQWAHLSLGVPKRMTEKDVQSFFRGFYSLSKKIGVSLVGGDLVRSNSDFFINIHLQGLVEKEKIMLRRHFKDGDRLCITGTLGDSAAGLHSFLQNKIQPQLLASHKKPPVLLEEGLWLAEREETCGMMDLSDGLMSDLERLPACGIEVHLENIPHSQALLEYCHRNTLDPLSFSLAGGEDYALLFSCRSDGWDQLKKSFKEKFRYEPISIGFIQKNKKNPIFLKNGIPQALRYESYQHF